MQISLLAVENRQGFEGPVVMEYENNWDDYVSDVRKCIDLIRNHKPHASSFKSATGLLRDYPLRPAPSSSVTLADQFWAPRIRAIHEITLPHIFDKLRNGGYMTQLEVAAGVSDKKFPGGFIFFESDFYKSMDAAGEILKIYPDPVLSGQIDGYAALISKVQRPDGYLNWVRAARGKMASEQAEKEFAGALGDEYYLNECRLSHELYCEGHLIEAAVSYYEATGHRNLLAAALRIANHLDQWFAEPRHRIPSGHQEIELALVKLYRVTGDERFLNLARMFLDERGHYRNQRPNMGAYGQDYAPVEEQREAVGHVVRGGYQYAAMVDITALTGDASYALAAARIWDDAVGRKMYVTGGLGIPRDEGFPDPYDLPNHSAYCESCGSVASMLWSYRLFLLTGDARYFDVLERTLYNGFLGSISLDGNEFNYVNPLESSGDHSRQPWHGCACCPPNIARFLAQVPGYAYATGKEKIYVNLYASGGAHLELEGSGLNVLQETAYPWDGTVKLTLHPERSHHFAICLRIPGWARNNPIPGDLYRFLDAFFETPQVLLNGQPVATDLDRGYAVIERTWQQGDHIELRFPMPARRVIAHKNVKEDAGKVAIQRGPLVYCAEAIDNKGHVFDTVLKDSVELTPQHEQKLGGVTSLCGEALRQNGNTSSPKPLMLVPYYAWNNRGLGEMAVFLAREPSTTAKSEPAFGFDYLPLRNRSDWKLSSSVNRGESELRKMVDGDRGTAFGSGVPQQPGVYLQIELPQITKLDWLILDSGAWGGDYARRCEITSSMDGLAWRRITEVKGEKPLMKVGLGGIEAKFLRITLTEKASNWWTLAEIELCQNAALDTHTKDR